MNPHQLLGGGKLVKDGDVSVPRDRLHFLGFWWKESLAMSCGQKDTTLSWRRNTGDDICFRAHGFCLRTQLRAEAEQICHWLLASWSGWHCWQLFCFFFLSEPQFCPFLTESNHFFSWGRKGTGWTDSILKKKETPSCTFSELWTMCLVATWITHLRPNWPPKLINARFHTKISCCQKECDNPLCSQSPLWSLWPPLIQAAPYNQLMLLIMNHGCDLIVSPFNTFQARFKEFGDVGLSSTLKLYKVFTKVGWGPWLRGDSALGPPV